MPSLFDALTTYGVDPNTRPYMSMDTSPGMNTQEFFNVYTEAAPAGVASAVGGLPDAAAAFAKYQQIAPGTETPIPAQIIQDVLNNPVYSAEQKELILEGYRQNIGLDEDLFNVIRNSAMGTVYTQEELEDIFKDTTDDDTTQTEIIDDKTDEPTLADIIGDWLERQTGPVTQERIRGVLDRYGRTVGDFNEAVADVEGIPEFEDFVTEADLATPPPAVVEDTTVTDKPKPSTTTSKPEPTELPKPTTTTTTTDEEEDKKEEKKEEKDYVDLNAPKPQLPTPGLPQQPITEPGGVGGMFAFAAPSPNRTTSEVLAPDLFKIDANIPLVGRLTQASPMAAPQYLLSGISQRYKV